MSGGAAGSEEKKETAAPKKQTSHKYTYTLTKSVVESHDTNIFTFAPPSNKASSSAAADVAPPVLKLLPGQHIRLEALGTDRPYTPIQVHADGSFEVLIKRYPQGKMSSHVHALKVGDTIGVHGPMGGFDYDAFLLREGGKFSHVVCLAAGTGIAPVYPVLEALVKDSAARAAKAKANAATAAAAAGAGAGAESKSGGAGAAAGEDPQTAPIRVDVLFSNRTMLDLLLFKQLGTRVRANCGAARRGALRRACRP